MVDTGITKEQFHRYVRVQKSGEYNMFSPEAMVVAGLSKGQFLEIMDKYNALEEKYGEAEE